MIVQRTSVFPAGQDAVFQKLKQLGTLQTIAAPYDSFEPLGDGVCTWEVGSTSTYCFRLFGCIPFGTHTIHIVRFDPDGIRSHEGNEHVPVWNHDIKLRPLDQSRTEYTDRVEIHAGWKTPFVWLWAEAFYAHRQRKWVGLLRQGERQR